MSKLYIPTNLLKATRRVDRYGGGVSQGFDANTSGPGSNAIDLGKWLAHALANGHIPLNQLPTADPKISGALWLNKGVLTVST